MLYNFKATREKIAELLDEADALIALAKEEKRELAVEDQSRIDAIMAEVGEQSADDKPASGLYAAAEKAAKLEAIRKDVSAARKPTAAHIIDPVTQAQSRNVPIRAMSHVGSLKAFRGGDEAKRDAYASGQFFLALTGNDRARSWCNDNGVAFVRNAMSGGDNELGGFLVPTEFEARVIDLRETYGIFRANTMVVPMGSDHKVVPRRKSGLTAYAVNDNTEITASDKEWNQVELTAKKWGALARYSSELNDDSIISMADNLADEMAYAFSLKEDQSGFIGDGTSTYHGTVGVVNKCNDGNHAASLYTALTGNTAFSTLDLADFEGVVGKLPQYAEAGAAWYISKIGYWASMARLADAAGGNTLGDIGSGPERQFLGFPVRFSQVMNTTVAAQTSTAGLALFGNLALASTLGDRRGFDVAVSSDRYFELDQFAIRGTTRTAINVHDVGVGSTTVGPMICLKTPSS